MIIYYPAVGDGTLMHALYQAKALVEVLSDPKNIAELAAASSAITVGLCEVISADRFTVNVDVNEKGKLYITVGGG